MRSETEAAIAAIRDVLPLLQAREGADELTGKAALDYATGTDLAVEQRLIHRLSEAFPAYGIVAEESGAHGSAETAWVIDPICGTANFANRLPLFNVNVALLERGLVTCAALLNGTSGEVYWAERGQGAYLDGRRIQVSDASQMLSVDFGHTTATGKTDRVGRLMREVLRQRLWSVRVLATSLVLAWVADGRFAGHIFDTISSWDLDAGALIAEEAGAIVTDFEGRPWSHESTQLVVAATPAIHARLLDLLRQ